MTTATGPTLSSTVRSARGPVLVGVLLLGGLLLLALLTRSGPAGRLDPGSYTPDGSRALATLLEDRGVDVRRVDDVGDAVGGTSRTTLLVPDPALLTAGELARLTARPGELVVLEAGPDDVEALALAVEVGEPVAVEDRRPACDLRAAAVAGDVDTGGYTYRARSGDSVGCYASRGRPTLLRLPSARTTLVGSADAFTNDRLADRGSAALALALLGTGDEVRWLVPAPGRAVPDGGRTPLSELLPDWVRPGVLQLLVATAALMLWRARQLGRVVPEPLPVVVRSAEAVEGRARLYRASGSRDRAAAALRAAARERLVRRLGLPVGAGEQALVAAVSARTGQDDVGALLAGPPPADDAALVRLADGLDALESRVGAG